MAIAKMSVADLEEFLRKEFPQAFTYDDIRIESADGETADDQTLGVDHDPLLRHFGGLGRERAHV